MKILRKIMPAILIAISIVMGILKAMDPKLSMVLKYLRIDNMTIEQTAEIMGI